jgi:3-hydroxyisobutyrate dehydrogenase
LYFLSAFPVDLAEKDMGYVVQAAGGTERAPTAEAVRSVFARASAAGLGAENLSAVRKLFG